MADKIYIKHSRKLELREINWWHILFLLFFSLLLQGSSHWDLCCSPWLTCSVSLWISPFQQWYQTISSYDCRKAKCTDEGPLQPSPESMPINLSQSDTPRAKSQSIRAYGCAILAQLHSALPLCHPGCVTLSLLQISLDRSSLLMSSKYPSLSQVSLHPPHLPALCLCTLNKGHSF